MKSEILHGMWQKEKLTNDGCSYDLVQGQQVAFGVLNSLVISDKIIVMRVSSSGHYNGFHSIEIVVCTY